MIRSLLIAALLSVSPLGESKIGIPYGISTGANVFLIFLICYFANVLVFPLMLFLLETVNNKFLKWKLYKGFAVTLAQKIKRQTKDKIKKYGFWGLLLFVMLPFPGTGVYAGTIATYILNINRKKAFMANSVGIFFSSLIVSGISLFADQVI